ncbi:hypothetical protein L345_02253, partial [Ophiophagus hannah]
MQRPLLTHLSLFQIYQEYPGHPSWLPNTLHVFSGLPGKDTVPSETHLELQEGTRRTSGRLPDLSQEYSECCLKPGNL